MTIYLVYRATSGWELVEKERRASALRWYFSQGVPVRRVIRKVIWSR